MKECASFEFNISLCLSSIFISTSDPSDKGLDEEGKNNFDIWLMNADGSNLTQLTTNGSYDDLPVFDPNGKYIYFRSNRGGNWDIWRMELALGY